MIITSNIQNIIQIHPCLLKLSRKQESVTERRTDGQTDGRPLLLYPPPLSRGDKKWASNESESINNLHGFKNMLLSWVVSFWLVSLVKYSV
jgi:hypothetical protein